MYRWSGLLLRLKHCNKNTPPKTAIDKNGLDAVYYIHICRSHAMNGKSNRPFPPREEHKRWKCSAAKTVKVRPGASGAMPRAHRSVIGGMSKKREWNRGFNRLSGTTPAGRFLFSRTTLSSNKRRKHDEVIQLYDPSKAGICTDYPG